VEERVQLRDGAEVFVRQVTPGDRQLFVDGFERFGMESRERRFLGVKKQLTEAELDQLTQVDHENHEAIGAIDCDTGAGIGVARIMRGVGGDHACAEAAVAVVDEWQGRGIGGVLLERLVRRAKEIGVERFLAVLRTNNRSMLELFKRAGSVDVRENEGGVLTIAVELPVDCPEESLEQALRSVAAGNVSAA
jgi:GNAT superfamily N-acetyltransferase